MSIIKDVLGNDLEYWPISGLIEGQTSEVLGFIVNGLPISHGSLYANDDDRIITWCRQSGLGSYQNLVTDPIDLTILYGDTAFEAYIEALSPISALERVPIGVIAGTCYPAGWFYPDETVSEGSISPGL